MAFMQKRREELSRTCAGLSAEPIEAQIQQVLKDGPCGDNIRRSNLLRL